MGKQRTDQDLCIKALHSIQNCEDMIHDITSEVSIIAAQFCTELKIETRRIVSCQDVSQVMASIMQFFVTAVDVDASRNWLRALINIATAEKGMVMKVGIDQMFDLQPEQADIIDTFGDSIRRYAQGDEELNGFMALMGISNQ
ncbi:hypothetical protein C2G38_2046939 [Gigaspora rosea]|uniref:Uncharacterized protein n=1 Tax=Gigaspora rosea TaxID=44941 RepID=A0A397U7K8_9GLOM|nr:hypothetical protein C2G38_2046939 [Gigaspora rosea]